jgi:hypothetical protein
LIFAPGAHLGSGRKAWEKSQAIPRSWVRDLTLSILVWMDVYSIYKDTI